MIFFQNHLILPRICVYMHAHVCLSVGRSLVIDKQYNCVKCSNMVYIAFVQLQQSNKVNKVNPLKLWRLAECYQF
jgi:hypothetical protein